MTPGTLCLVLGEAAFAVLVTSLPHAPAGLHVKGCTSALCASFCNSVKDAGVFWDGVCSLSLKYDLLKLSPELSCCRVTAVSQARDSVLRELEFMLGTEEFRECFPHHRAMAVLSR